MAILLCSVVIYSCNSQKRFVKNDNLCGFDDDILLKEKTLSLSKKQDSLLLHKKLIEVINNKSTESTLFKHPTYGTITNKLTNKQTNIEKSLVYEKGKLIGSFFSYVKGGENIGKETHYDTDGTITKVIDHRQADKYPICYKEAMAIVKRRMANRDTIFSLGKGKWVTKTKDTVRTWEVFVREIDKKKEEEKSWVYRVNAVTGEIINKKEVISNPR